MAGESGANFNRSKKPLDQAKSSPIKLVQLGIFLSYFLKLKLYNVLKLDSFCSGLKSLDCFAFNNLALNSKALKVFS